MNSPATRIRTELEKGVASSVVSLLNLLIQHGHNFRASDIHIHPSREDLVIRFRVDGVLHDAFHIPKTIHSEIISRIKIVASIRTDLHHSPQDGRFRAILEDGAELDIRVSIVPTHHGENAVLRLLAQRGETLTLEALGFSLSDRERINQALKTSSGMIIATGPTGSGKTTTLYALLQLLNTRASSIVTIEDPIEYSIQGITQIQVHQSGGLTFASGLRSILRQDPNIIMVGEIRDEETARIAVNTALTGHLLLSTLHTSDASSILPRLLDMSIESYLVASTVSLAIGQRLIRTICESCKIEKHLSNNEYHGLTEAFRSNFVEGTPLYCGQGCKNCDETGYKGRTMVNEVLIVDDPIREAILEKASSGEIHRIAVENGMTTMLMDGIEKAKRGITTIEEIFRTVHE